MFYIMDKIKKIFGYNILTSGLRKEKVDKYDIALITLCKIYRINIKAQEFFTDKVVDSIRVPLTQDLSFRVKEHIVTLFESISVKRNHHLIFFQYLVKLLCNHKEVSKTRIDTLTLISIYLLIRYDKAYVQELIDKWVSKDFQSSFLVYSNEIVYLESFSRSYQREWWNANMQVASKVFDSFVDSEEFYWWVWDRGSKWMNFWRKQVENVKTKSQKSTYSNKDKQLAKCYQVLGITFTKDKSIIKSAYRKMCLKYHPDKGGSQERFIQINQSYEYLITHV